MEAPVVQMSDPDESAPRVSEESAVKLFKILQKRGYCALQERQDGSSFATRDRIQSEFCQLVTRKGRITLSDASKQLGFSVSFFDLSEYWVVKKGSLPYEVLSTQFLQEFTLHLQAKLQSERHVTVLSIAESNKWSLEETWRLLETRNLLQTDTWKLLHGKTLVLDAFLDECCVTLREELLAASTPFDITKESQIDSEWTQYVIQKGSIGNLPGHWQGSTYIPDNFVEQQRANVVEAFVTNGFLTDRTAQKQFQISPSQLREYLDNADDATVLTHCLVHASLVMPLRGALEQAVEDATWLDLQPLLPVELLDKLPEDMIRLVQELSTSRGHACIERDGTIFLSEGFIREIETDQLPTVIELEAERQAKTLFGQSETTNEGSDAKSQRTNRDEAEASKVPLESIQRRLIETYPELGSFDDTLILTVCQQVFDTVAWDTKYAEAISKELERLESESKATLVTLDDFKSIELAFEDTGCFPSACFLLQARAKFVKYAIGSPHVSNEAKALMEIDLLSGCCADLVSRITQYSLFRNGVTEVFSFSKGNKTPPFYSSVNLASRSYDVFLSCLIHSGSGKLADPLAALRETLPSAAGVAVARLWALCGTQSYETSKVSNGKLDEFITQLHDNCFTVCGLPFTNMDKKSEKKMLHARRQQLVGAIEKCNDPVEVVDLRIMLMYQLVKNMVVVSNDDQRAALVNMLSSERKASPDEVATLQDCVQQISNGQAIGQETILQIKNLSRSTRK